MKRIFLAIILAGVWHSSAYAEYYYWAYDSSGRKFPSATAACQAAYANDATWNFVRIGPYGSGDPITAYRCYANTKVDPAPHKESSHFIANRRGNSCPPDTQYDPVTTQCQAPQNPCLDKAGLEAPFSKAGTAPDQFMNISSSGYGVPQRQGCKDGCAVEITDLRCKTFTAGPYLCRGLMGYTGQQCSTTGTGSEVAEDVNDSVAPETVKEDKPCVYETVGDKQVCQSKKSEEKTGESCGQVNGVEKCIPKDGLK